MLAIFQNFLRTAVALSLAVTIFSSEAHYGLVEGVVGDEVTITMRPGPMIEPGSILAIHGPGTVQRHPLTQEIILEERSLVAKVVVESVASGNLKSRILWRSGAIEAGFDAVAYSGPRPNGAPARAAVAATAQRIDSQGAHEGVASTAIPAQSTVLLSLPVRDPDGDELFFRWHLEGEAVGSLHQTHGNTPLLAWTAPALAGQTVTLVGTAQDHWGQTVRLEETLTTDKPIAAWNRRRSFLGGSRQNSATAIVHHTQLGEGITLYVGSDGVVYRRQGWFGMSPFAFADGQAPRQVKRIQAMPDGGFVVLTSLNGEAHRYHASGARITTMGGMKAPNDIAVLPHGGIAISDNEAGGIHVFANDGSYRALIGRGLSPSRMRTHPDGRVLVLDGATLREFDPWWHPLRQWQIPSERNVSVVDIAYHRNSDEADGRLVLMSDGSLRFYNQDGLLLQQWEVASTHPFAGSFSKPEALHVASDGQITLTFPEQKRRLRLNADGEHLATWMPMPSDAFYAFANGELFAADWDSKQCYQFNAQGWVIAARPLPDSMRDLDALAVSANGKYLALLDGRSEQIHILNAQDPRQAGLVVGQSGRDRGQLRSAEDLALDNQGNVYVLDSGNEKVVVFSADGRLVSEWGEGGRGDHNLRSPELIAVSPDGSNVAIYDHSNYLIKRFAINTQTGSAQHLGNVGGRGSDPGQVRSVVGLGIDRLGLLYVADSSREDIQVWDVQGGNAVTVHQIDLTQLGISRLNQMALGADGIIVGIGRQELAIHHW